MPCGNCDHKIMQSLPRRALQYVCLLLMLSGSAAAQQPITVAKLTDFIKSAIQLKNPDKDVAAAVSKFRLTEKFTLSDMGDLQNAGAGEKTVAALAVLVKQSAALPSPVKTVVAEKVGGPPEPPAAEKNQVLEKTRAGALDYVKSLPDFLCLEDTDRSIDSHYRAGAEGSWSHQDRVIEKLTFFDHKENYELFMHNETAVVAKTSESLGGARSTGDWASLLAEIFEPSSQTNFLWTRWATVRGRLTHVYRYSIERQYSHQTVARGEREKIVAGIAGEVFVEKGTNAILRVTVIPDIPPDFPIQDVNQTVDYDYQKIGDRTYLLPSTSTVLMRDGQVGSRNDIRWRSYRKYSADTTLTFDDSDTPAAGK